jgi:NAD(P)H-nitrite reductase large subunit
MINYPGISCKNFRPGEFEELNVKLNLETEIVEINRADKYVVDKQGHRHGYDKLILATGRARISRRMHPSITGNIYDAYPALMQIH